MSWAVVAETLDRAVFYLISLAICVSTCVILSYIYVRGAYVKKEQSPAGGCVTYSEDSHL